MRGTTSTTWKFMLAAVLAGVWVCARPDGTALARSAPDDKRVKLGGEGTDVGVDRDKAPRKARTRKVRHRKRRRWYRRRPRTARPARTTARHTRWLRPSRSWADRHRQGRLSDPRYYAGVVPGTNHPPPDGLPTRSEPCYLTWPGFQQSAKGSRLFFQFTSKPAAVLDREGRVITVTFPECRTRLRNNRRRLVTKYFRTPVTSVTIRRRRGALTVTIRLRSPAKPSESWSTQGRFHFYFLQFGSYSGPMPKRAERRRRRSRDSIESRGGYIRIRRERTRSR